MVPVDQDLPVDAVAVLPGGGRVWRLTLTAKWLRMARRVAFLAAGAGNETRWPGPCDGDRTAPAAWVRGAADTLFLVTARPRDRDRTRREGMCGMREAASADGRLQQFVRGLYFDLQRIEGVKPLEIWNGVREFFDPFEKANLVKNLYKIVVPLVNEAVLRPAVRGARGDGPRRRRAGCRLVRGEPGVAPVRPVPLPSRRRG